MDIRNLPVDAVGTYTYYGVEYRPSGSPYFNFTKSGAVVATWWFNSFVPTEAWVAGEIRNNGDQYPGDGSNWMGYFDMHKYHWGYWTALAPTSAAIETHSALDGVYYGTTLLARYNLQLARGR